MKRSFNIPKRVILEHTTNDIAAKTVHDTKDSKDSMNMARRARHMRPLTHFNFASLGLALSSIGNERPHGPRRSTKCIAHRVVLTEKKSRPSTSLITCQNYLTAQRAGRQRCKRQHTTKLKRLTMIRLRNLTVLEISWSWITQTYSIQNRHPVTKTKRCA